MQRHSPGDRIGLDPRPPIEEQWTGSESPVVWRTWQIAPRAARHRGPLLTGIGGFPWDGPLLHARCTEQERPATGGFSTRPADRYHPVVPDPDCSCGIHALRRAVGVQTGGPRSIPTVSGFVSLEGRILIERDRFRAQRARMVGPLGLDPIRAGLGAALLRRFGVHLRQRRVVDDGTTYRILWGPGRAGEPLRAWVDRVIPAIRSRYGVDVVAPSGSWDE